MLLLSNFCKPRYSHLYMEILTDCNQCNPYSFFHLSKQGRRWSSLAASWMGCSWPRELQDTSTLISWGAEQPFPAGKVPEHISPLGTGWCETEWGKGGTHIEVSFWSHESPGNPKIMLLLTLQLWWEVLSPLGKEPEETACKYSSKHISKRGYLCLHLFSKYSNCWWIVFGTCCLTDSSFPIHTLDQS